MTWLCETGKSLWWRAAVCISDLGVEKRHDSGRDSLLRVDRDDETQSCGCGSGTRIQECDEQCQKRLQTRGSQGEREDDRPLFWVAFKVVCG